MEHLRARPAAAGARPAVGVRAEEHPLGVHVVRDVLEGGAGPELRVRY